VRLTLRMKDHLPRLSKSLSPGGDIAPTRSVVERVIGRMKTMFKMNAGPIFRTQLVFLACFLILSAGIINRMIEENDEMFVQDIRQEERDEKNLRIYLLSSEMVATNFVKGKRNKFSFKLSVKN